MSDEFLMWAAYFALAVGSALVVYHLTMPYVPRAWRVRRFRRRMDGLDAVVTSWRLEMNSGRDPADES